MTAPDPRPYAGPTDLVTAADVLAWLEEQAKAHRLGMRYRVVASPSWGTIAAHLRARLDRERRQRDTKAERARRP